MYNHECACGAKFAGSKSATFCPTCKEKRLRAAVIRQILKAKGIRYPNLCCTCGIEIPARRRYCDECRHQKTLKMQRNRDRRKRKIQNHYPELAKNATLGGVVPDRFSK